jgi:hypothetical protein
LNEVIRVISNIIILLILITIFGALIVSYIENYYGYEFITMQDERGISRKCYANDKGLFCKTKDGLVEVKQFGKR